MWRYSSILFILILSLPTTSLAQVKPAVPPPFVDQKQKDLKALQDRLKFCNPQYVYTPGEEPVISACEPITDDYCADQNESFYPEWTRRCQRKL